MLDEGKKVIQDKEETDERPDFEPLGAPPVQQGGIGNIFIPIIIAIIVSWAMISLVGITKGTHQSDITRLENDLVSARETDSSLTAQIESVETIQQTIKDDLNNNYAKKTTLSNYVLTSILDSYVQKPDLTTYVQESELDIYAKKAVTTNLTNDFGNMTENYEDILDEIEDILERLKDLEELT